MSKSCCVVQLGFSEPLVEDCDKELVAHNSPIWNDWDGGQIGGKPCWINPRDIPKKVLRCTICAQRKKEEKMKKMENTESNKEKENNKDGDNDDNDNTNDKKIPILKSDECNNKDKNENNMVKNNDDNTGDGKSSENDIDIDIDNEGTILRFLAQIYSPVDSVTQNEAAFHRSFYVFGCPHILCSSSDKAHESIVVLRGQMCRENEFYPYDNDNEEEWKLHKSETWDVNLCIVCGQHAKGRCPLSKKWFCSKEHQRDYHKLLKDAKKKHKKQNGKDNEDNENGDDDDGDDDIINLSSLIYVESELVVEEEPMGEGKTDDYDNDIEKKLAHKMNKDTLFADTDDVDDDGADDGLLEQSDLNQMTGIGDMIRGTDDEVTMEFYTRTGRDDGDVKGQCLRYCRWPDDLRSSDKKDDDGDGDDDDNEGKELNENGPLWISSTNRPNVAKDIPPCQYCGAERKFEFQLMPQIIHMLTHRSDNTNDNDSTKISDDFNISEDGQQALLAASDIIDQAKEDGKEADLPEGFEKTQKELVEKLKQKVFNEIIDGSGGNGDDIDFGIISVYTCTGSCGDGKMEDNESPLGIYRKEFAWRQPPLK